MHTEYMNGDIVEPAALGEDCEVVECGVNREMNVDGSLGGFFIVVRRSNGEFFTCLESEVTPKQAVIVQRSTWVAGQPRPTS